MSFILDYDSNYMMIKTQTNPLYADLIMPMNLIDVWGKYLFNIKYIILLI